MEECSPQRTPRAQSKAKNCGEWEQGRGTQDPGTHSVPGAPSSFAGVVDGVGENLTPEGVSYRLGEQGEEGGFVFVGEVFDLAGTSAGYVNGVAGGEEFLVGLAEDFVAEFEGAGFGFEDAGADGEEFVVASGMVVAAVDVGDDHVGVVLGFQLLVVEAEGAHEFNAADFKPDEEVGVVDDAHLIGFGVADADGDIVMSEHWWWQ